MDIDHYSPTPLCQLASLLRSSLWQSEVDLRPFASSSVDWSEIGRMATEQTVAVLVAKAAMSLPESLLPPKGWLRNAYAMIERNRRTHLLLDSCVAEGGSRLEDAGLTPVLLKGQAYARCYPEQWLRQCGDIDLYVGEAAYMSAFKTVFKRGWECDKEIDPKAKHFGCRLHGVRVEIHRVAACLASPWANKRFEAWSRQQLSSGGRSVSIGDRAIAVPSAIFDVVFVFLHLYNHFINGGVGLRQICDWVMLLHAHAGSIDETELKKCLQAFGLMRAWRKFTPIAVDVLGLPKPECPFYSSSCRRKAERILDIIMREGNFGKFIKRRSQRPADYWRGKFHTLTHISRRIFSIMRIDFVTGTMAYGRFLLLGCRHVVKDKFFKV